MRASAAWRDVTINVPPGLVKLVDGLQTVPGPGLNALAHGVVHVNGYVDLTRFIDGQVFFQFFGAVGYDGELLCGNAIALRRVAIAAKSGAYFAFFTGGKNDGADDVPGQGFLENPPVHHLHCHCAHFGEASSVIDAAL